MAALNPFQLLLMLRNNNPQQVAEQLINNSYPQMAGLLDLARKGDTQSLEKIAKNIMGDVDISQEINKIQSSIKNL